MPITCQLDGAARPGLERVAPPVQRRNDGFVKASAVTWRWAIGTSTRLPFYYSLAQHFPIADRWFCSLLARRSEPPLPVRRHLGRA